MLCAWHFASGAACWLAHSEIVSRSVRDLTQSILEVRGTCNKSVWNAEREREREKCQTEIEKEREGEKETLSVCLSLSLSLSLINTCDLVVSSNTSKCSDREGDGW